MLGDSSSGYYAWLTRETSQRRSKDEKLQADRADHRDSRQTYGAPRILVELHVVDGERVSRKRVARLMRQAGLRGVSRRKTFRTTRRDPAARPAPDLPETQSKGQTLDLRLSGTTHLFE